MITISSILIKEGRGYLFDKLDEICGYPEKVSYTRPEIKNGYNYSPYSEYEWEVVLGS
jgi:hypothetical protein